MIERLDHFMARANAAYYAEHDPFADFTTSPEISQVFGELLGLWCGAVWQSMDAPKPVAFVEAGPGRGTLMTDALRAVGRALPAFVSAQSLHFIETSPRLIPILRAAFPVATIHRDLAHLPPEPLLLLANEFFDALPIRQFVRRPGGWAERYVEDNQFVDQPPDLVLDRARDIEPAGTIRERSDIAAAMIMTVARHLRCHGGAALIIDYGPAESGLGDTLQAIGAGRPADPLAAPGTVDLTAHVDFAALAAHAVATGCAVSGPVTQGAFLTALGIHERTAQLGRLADPAACLSLMAATRRLTTQEAMGSLFKVMAISHPSLPTLPGFCE